MRIKRLPCVAQKWSLAFSCIGLYLITVNQESYGFPMWFPLVLQCPCYVAVRTMWNHAKNNRNTIKTCLSFTNPCKSIFACLSCKSMHLTGRTQELMCSCKMDHVSRLWNSNRNESAVWRFRLLLAYFPVPVTWFPSNVGNGTVATNLSAGLTKPSQIPQCNSYETFTKFGRFNEK